MARILHARLEHVEAFRFHCLRTCIILVVTSICMNSLKGNNLVPFCRCESHSGQKNLNEPSMGVWVKTVLSFEPE